MTRSRGVLQGYNSLAVVDDRADSGIGPAGHELYQSGKNMLFNGYRVDHFKAPITACRSCPLRTQCLRHPERTPQRSVCFY